MRMRLFTIVAFLLIATLAFGMQTNRNANNVWPSILGSGGPDSFGYTWIDSDETGGPTFNWIDITTIGNAVAGLGDDNNVGPIPIGFDFPYYWYPVNEFWVESNGGISFSDANVYTPQGASGFFIPNTAVPNDIVIPLGADLTFQDGLPAECYYYSNNVDTFIVSFIKVPAWTSGGIVGEHSFQIILTGADSCIYFQYGPQSGQFYGGSDCAGIEDVIGDVGLQVFLNKNPDLLPNYAVQFIPPDSTSYQALDIGIKDAVTPGSKGVFLFPGEPYAITTTIRNYGNVDAGTFTVTSILWDTSGTTHYTDTVTVASMVAGSETTITFTPDWTPSSVNDYFTLIQTHLTGDINPTNNSKDVEFEVLNLPGWMTYDSDPASASGYAWLGAGGGWGQEFEPPQYPITINQISLAMSSTNSCNVPILFLDDDGNNGSPGTLLYADTIFVPAGTGFNHYLVNIPSGPGTISDGKFYVGMIQVGDSFPRIMMEDVGPFSRRGWEFTGTWAPSRDRETWEMLVRAHTNDPQAVSEGIEGKTYVLSLLPTNPNPVKNNAVIYYALPKDADVSLKIYNLLGQEIRTLINGHESAGIHSVVFNSKDAKGNALPQGVYFYRLTADDRSLTRKLTLLR